MSTGIFSTVIARSAATKQSPCRCTRPAASALVFALTLLLALALAILGIPVVQVPQPAQAFAPIPGQSVLDWNQVGEVGLGNTANAYISTLQVYGDYLYAGTNNMLGCELYRYDGARVEMLVGEGLPTFRSPGFGNTENDGISSMAVYDGALYMGTYNVATGCELWRHNGTDYEKIVGTGRPGFQAPGFGNPDNYSISAMAVMGDYLYLGTSNDDGCELWRYDGTTFSEYWILGPGFGDADNRAVRSMAVYEGAVYLGTLNTTDGCDLFRWDGTAFTQMVGQSPPGTPVTGPGFGDTANVLAQSMVVHDGCLHVGTHNPMTGCEVWRWNGAAWAKIAGAGRPGHSGPGFGNAENQGAWSLASYGPYLYAGTLNNAEGCEVWRYNSVAWAPEAVAGLGSDTTSPVASMCVYGAGMYVGTTNHMEGGRLYSAANNFYFAEGYTGDGFQEYLCLGNPETGDAAATITYLFEDGTSRRQSLTVPAGSRATVDVNAAAGPGRSVSAHVQSDRAIAVERPMYFSYGAQGWTGGHDVMGATSLAGYWFFAEGYTGPGFEEWICVLNPGDGPAELTFNFQTQEAGPIVRGGITLAPHSRGSYRINDLLGPGYQCSLQLMSSQPVVAERPMYFDYSGTGTPKHWTGGHCVMGASALSPRYYFAEGTTREGFDEWLTIQNPGLMPITVDATYQPAPGQGGNVARTYTLLPGTRYTAYVPAEAGTDKDVSILLETTGGPFLAERPMYFDYTGFGAPGWEGGHCVIGSPDTAALWFFAEGYTGAGFQEWLCLQNPGDAEATVQIDYYTQEEGQLDPRIVVVPPHTRLNVRVNDNAGPGYQLSCRLHVNLGPEIVVERPMYFDYGGTWEGGHDVVGLRR